MAFRSKRSKAVPFNAADIAKAAKSNPYVQRLIDDPKLRKNVSTAVDASKSAYERVNNGKIEVRSLLEDKKLHADLARALGAARDVTIVLTATRRRRRSLTFGRAVVIAGIGAGVALAASEQLRSKALDLLFGAEEEFQYTPPPSTPASPSQTTVGAA